MKRAAALLAVGLLAATTAQAGRRPYIWTWDTETLPEGDVELEQWQWFVVREAGASARSAWWFWWSPIVGLTDSLELAFPLELVARRASGFAWADQVLELRWRIVDPPAADDGGFPWSLALRAGVQQDFLGGRQLLQQNLIVSLGRTEGMHLTVDLGLRERARLSLQPLDVSLGIGATSRRFGPLRFGGELFFDMRAAPRDGAFEDHFFLGPNVSYAKGRVWSTFGLLFGLTADTPDVMPRLIFAVAI